MGRRPRISVSAGMRVLLLTFLSSCALATPSSSPTGQPTPTPGSGKGEEKPPSDPSAAPTGQPTLVAEKVPKGSSLGGTFHIYDGVSTVPIWSEVVPQKVSHVSFTIADEDIRARKGRISPRLYRATLVSMYPTIDCWVTYGCSLEMRVFRHADNNFDTRVRVLIDVFIDAHTNTTRVLDEMSLLLRDPAKQAKLDEDISDLLSLTG